MGLINKAIIVQACHPSSRSVTTIINVIRSHLVTAAPVVLTLTTGSCLLQILASFSQGLLQLDDLLDLLLPRHPVVRPGHLVGLVPGGVARARRDPVHVGGGQAARVHFGRGLLHHPAW